MNETFSFSRFARYFVYDLKQNWRRHSRAAIMIGCASVFFYLIWVLFSLVFTQQWTSPVLPARLLVFLLAFGILELYYAYLYGFLTDKQKGSAYLMIPASSAEKFVSLLVISLIVIPVLFAVVYLVLDGFLSLVDPTYGKALVSSISSAYNELIGGVAAIKGEDIPFSISQLVYPSVIGWFFNFLFFLLCGMFFKKYKIIGAIAISFLFGTLLTTVLGFSAQPMADYLSSMEFETFTQEQTVHLVRTFLTWINVIFSVVTLALGAGIYYRIKTLKH